MSHSVPAPREVVEVNVIDVYVKADMLAVQLLVTACVGEVNVNAELTALTQILKFVP